MMTLRLLWAVPYTWWYLFYENLKRRHYKGLLLLLNPVVFLILCVTLYEYANEILPSISKLVSKDNMNA
jgi:hypothetical protein